MAHRDSGARTIRGEIIPPPRRGAVGVADGDIIDLYPAFDRPIAYAPDQAGPRGSSKLLLRLLWAVLILLVLAAGLLALRGPIVDAVPQLSKVYSSIGLPTGPAGLTAEDIRVVRVYSRGWVGLSVEGTIANPTGRQVEIPEVALLLRGADGATLQTLPVSPSRTILNPGVAAQFTTEIANPPTGVAAIVVRIGNAESRPIPVN